MLGLPAEFTPSFLARLDHLKIRTRREYAGMGKGVHLSPRRGASLEFADFRPYTVGDDFRYIDWGLYGRTDKLYIKQFKEEEDLLTYVFLDASGSMAFPQSDHKFESAVAMTLALAYVALSSGDRVMVRVLAGKGETIRPSFVLGTHRIIDLARQLDAVKPAGDLDLASALAQELVVIKRAGKIFVVSDYLMMLNNVTRGLGLFTAANMDVTAVQILGAREIDGTGLEGNLELVDAESGERVRASMNPRAQARYRETIKRLGREVRAFCLKRGMRYTLYTGDQSFDEAFVRAAVELGLAH
jgi:uncharacterized protein (DUF58 family)